MAIESKGSEQARILEAMEEYYGIRLETEGGYPAEIDGETIPGYIVVADLDHDGGPELHIYRWPYVRAWYARALALMEEGHGDDEEELTIGEALFEVESDVP